jgi:DNA-directed RNA polymerase II subunit RPB2
MESRLNLELQTLENRFESLIKSQFRKKVESLSVMDIPMPECITRAVSTVYDKSEAPGEIKTDTEGHLLKEYLQYEGLIKPMIQAFDYFIDVQLPRRIQKTSIPFSLGTITFEEVMIMKPSMIDQSDKTEKRIPIFPYMCRRNKTSYTVSLKCKIVFTPKDESRKIEKINFNLGEIPVMLGSKYCNLYGLDARQLVDKRECQYDPFGYFIIEGAEKVVLQHEKLRYNRPFIFQEKNKKSATGKFEQSVNLNSKKRELNPNICRFTAIPTIDIDPKMIEPKVYTAGIRYDAKKTTVVNIYYDLKTRALILRLDKFQMDTYLNIFYIYELFGKNSETAKQMILHYVDQKSSSQSKIMTFLNRFEVEYKKNTDLLAVLKGVMRMPPEVEKMPTDKQKEYYQETISEVLFKQIEGPPHTEKGRRYDAKLQMLSIMCAKYSEFLNNLRPANARDSWGNKRVVSAGPAMEHLFNQIWTMMMVNNLIAYLSTVTINQQQTFNLMGAVQQLPSNLIKTTFIDSFTPGQWGISGSILKENMTDILKNENLLAKYSQLLRISPDTSDKGRQEQAREVNPTQLGYICPIETPEGKQCGIVKGMSVGCYLSIPRDEGIVLRYIVLNKLVKMKSDVSYDSAFVLNGKFIGWCQGQICEAILKNARRTQLIDRDVMVYYEQPRVLWVYCDGGRPTRPLLVVNPQTDRLVIDEKNLWTAKFDDLLKNGAVEYIDALEQEANCIVAQSIWNIMERKEELNTIVNTTGQRQTDLYPAYRALNKPKYTHSEMDPNAILSVVASIIPMPDRSQAPRNTYQVAMGKAALAIQSTNAINRYDTSLKSLVYAAPAVFKTQMYSMIGLDDNPFGETVMVAIMPFKGYNQEDSIIVNGAALERGRFRILRTLTYKSVQLNGKNYNEVMGKPIKKGIPNLASLDEDGVIIPGTKVKQGDCLIGKYKQYFNGDVADASTYVGVGDSGIVERVLKTTSTDSQKIVMVKIREVRIPRAGDKFASRYAQKGTVGIVLPQEDMPQIVTGPSSGISPDLIINPLAIPSRMTIGKLVEIVTSKVAVMRGETVNATAFRNFDLETYCDNLSMYGYDRYGTETMINGMTGEQFESRIFVGPCYYQALKHHVQDKIQQRAKGPVKLTTHQPTAGRTNQGGLKLGEMEKDAIASAGAFACLREKTFDHSDAYKTVFCKKCGTIANVNKVNMDTVCALCGDKKYGMVSIPYSYKVLSHELMAASLQIRLKLKSKDKELLV